MCLALRTYQALEEGAAPCTLQRLNAYAEAVDCDALAMLMALHADDELLSIRASDNKFVSILAGELSDYVRARSDLLSRLTPRSLFSIAASVISALDVSVDAALRSERPAPNLSIRQLQCLHWVRAGKSSADIAIILGLSTRTVDHHIRRACTRLSVRTRIQAVSVAISLGILPPQDAMTPPRQVR